MARSSTCGRAAAGTARIRSLTLTLTEKLMTCALGRGVDYDEPAVRGIVRTASRDDFRFVSFIRGVVQSVPFQMRRAK